MKEIFSTKNLTTFVLVFVACTIAVVVGVPIAASIKAKFTATPAPTSTGGA